MAPHPNARIASLLAALKDALVDKHSQLPTLPYHPDPYPTHPNTEHNNQAKLIKAFYKSVGCLLDDALASHADEWDWPQVALDSLARMSAEVRKWSWTGDCEVDWAEVVLFKDWFGKILSQVDCFGFVLQRDAQLHSAVGRIELARETIARSLARSLAIRGEDQHLIRTEEVGALLHIAEHQLGAAAHHPEEELEAHGSTIERVVCNAIALELLLVGYIPQLKDKDEPVGLAQDLEKDARLLKQAVELSGVESSIGRRAARMYETERGALNRDKVWSRMI